MSSIVTWSFYVIVFGALGTLALHDRARAWLVVKAAIKAFLAILPVMLVMVGLIGILLGLVPPEFITRYLGKAAGWWASISAFLLGAVLYIGSLVSIPLAASLLRTGASLITIAAFITGLMMVNTVTLPLEIKYLGKKMALGRNLLSLIFAFAIAVVIGWVLG